MSQDETKETKSTESIIIINARGTKIEIPYNIAERSDLIKIWYQALDKDDKENKIPEIRVNFSANDIHKLLDYMSFNYYHLYDNDDDEKFPLLCTYFGLKTIIGLSRITVCEIILDPVSGHGSRYIVNFLQHFRQLDGKFEINNGHKLKKISFMIDIDKNIRVDSFNGQLDKFDSFTINSINQLIKKRIICPSEPISKSSNMGYKIFVQIAQIIAEIYDVKIEKII